ncbi:hypothetical protein CsSME_00029113 [Camellia sinensis var. sinensis]
MLLLKPLIKFLMLLWFLCVKILAPDVFIVQNPPSVPTLVAVKWASWLRRSAFIIDWHNFGYTLLALSLGKSSVLWQYTIGLRSILGRWPMVPYARQGQCNMNWHKTGELSQG